MSKESSEKNEPIGIPPLKSDIRDVGKSQVDFVRERAKELLPMLCEQYAVLHEHPELGGEEFRTAEQIKKFLEAEGIEIVGEKIGSIKGSKGTGIVARIKGKEGGPTIALRADMDALPLQENKDHNHCSQEGNKMHACGHDAHMTGLIGGAIITDEGGITSHAAIMSREFKKPCIIGTKIATQVLKDGDLVEVDADNGVVRILERAK